MPPCKTRFLGQPGARTSCSPGSRFTTHCKRNRRLRQLNKSPPSGEKRCENTRTLRDWYCHMCTTSRTLQMEAQAPLIHRQLITNQNGVTSQKTIICIQGSSHSTVIEKLTVAQSFTELLQLLSETRKLLSISKSWRLLASPKPKGNYHLQNPKTTTIFKPEGY
jgi:hypothetical protein